MGIVYYLEGNLEKAIEFHERYLKLIKIIQISLFPL
jgi:hypothetical protein